MHAALIRQLACGLSSEAWRTTALRAKAGTGANERSGDVLVTGNDGEHQSREVVLRRYVERGASEDEQVDDSRVPVVRREHQGRLSVIIRGVGIDAFQKQFPHRLRVPSHNSPFPLVRHGRLLMRARAASRRSLRQRTDYGGTTSGVDDGW